MPEFLKKKLKIYFCDLYINEPHGKALPFSKWLTSEYHLEQIDSFLESDIIFFTSFSDISLFVKVMELQLSLRNVSNQKFIFDLKGVDVSHSPLRFFFHGLHTLFRERKFSKFILVKSAIEHVIQLSDAVVVDTQKVAAEMRIRKKDMLQVSGFPVGSVDHKEEKEQQIQNQNLFERFRDSDTPFRESIRLEQKLESKRLHAYDGENYIYTKKDKIFVCYLGNMKAVAIPGAKLHKFAVTRILERLFRSDQYNVLTYGSFESFFVLRDGKIFFVDMTTASVTCISQPLGCRGIMHRAHCLLPDGRLLFGEYGHRPSKGYIPLYVLFPENGHLEELDALALVKAKHIHAIRWDEFSKTVWICTGDKDGECHIIVLSKDLKIVDRIGDGSQLYRTCDFIFGDEEVIWVMDSPIEESKVVAYSRLDHSITIHQSVPGPAWYAVNGLHGRHLLSIASEPGSSVATNGPQILMSRDCKSWERILHLRKDMWPYVFKYGVCEIGSDVQDYFYVNYQATVFNDGHSEMFKITDIQEKQY
jgi:hypothetical protein